MTIDTILDLDKLLKDTIKKDHEYYYFKAIDCATGKSLITIRVADPNNFEVVFSKGTGYKGSTKEYLLDKNYKLIKEFEEVYLTEDCSYYKIRVINGIYSVIGVK